MHSARRSTRNARSASPRPSPKGKSGRLRARSLSCSESSGGYLLMGLLCDGGLSGAGVVWSGVVGGCGGWAVCIADLPHTHTPPPVPY